MSQIREFAIYWIPVLIYAGLILTFSSRSNLPGSFDLPDKPIHALEYVGLAALVARALLTGRTHAQGRQLWLIFLLTSSFAALDEYFQSYIPGRDSSFRDWLADVTGIGLVISLLLLRRRKEQAHA